MVSRPSAPLFTTRSSIFITPPQRWETIFSPAACRALEPAPPPVSTMSAGMPFHISVTSRVRSRMTRRAWKLCQGLPWPGLQGWLLTIPLSPSLSRVLRISSKSTATGCGRNSDHSAKSLGEKSV